MPAAASNHCIDIGHRQHLTCGAPQAQEPSPSYELLPHTVVVTFYRQANRPGHCTCSSRSKSQLLTTSTKD